MLDTCLKVLQVQFKPRPYLSITLTDFKELLTGREDVYDLMIRGLEARFFNAEFQSHSVFSSSHNAEGSSRRRGPDSEK